MYALLSADEIKEWLIKLCYNKTIKCTYRMEIAIYSQ